MRAPQIRLHVRHGELKISTQLSLHIPLHDRECLLHVLLHGALQLVYLLRIRLSRTYKLHLSRLLFDLAALLWSGGRWCRLRLRNRGSPSPVLESLSAVRALCPRAMLVSPTTLMQMEATGLLLALLLLSVSPLPLQQRELI
eukprot:6487919-Amphidinium_carterae.2